MADLATIYTLATPGGTISFNSGTLGSGSLNDLYWLSAVHGLDGPTIRAPVDNVPFGDGGLIHRFWKGPRRPTFEGSLIVQSVPFGGNCQAAFNTLESNLNTALNSILQAAGTLSWTPAGGSAHSLSVYYEVFLDILETDNFLTRSFTFGLVSPSADPS